MPGYRWRDALEAIPSAKTESLREMLSWLNAVSLLPEGLRELRAALCRELMDRAAQHALEELELQAALYEHRGSRR